MPDFGDWNPGEDLDLFKILGFISPGAGEEGGEAIEQEKGVGLRSEDGSAS